MPDDRTTVTELATALGTLPHPDLTAALAARHPALRIDAETWERLGVLHTAGAHDADFRAAYGNGRALLMAPDGLARRPPRLIEWTGGRRPPGDEVAPIDLRIDHVYLVSCKYLSANIANTSPGRLFDGLLATTGAWERTDWFAAVAPAELEALYDACRTATGLSDLPDRPADLSPGQRRRLRDALDTRDYPGAARPAYHALSRAVSEASASRWRDSLTRGREEQMLWRLLRIGSAPYFLLGSHHHRPVRLRVATPWDWRQHFRFEQLTVGAAAAGQPRVDWVATYADRARRVRRSVRGHVEIRWSHGRFAQPPEAKIYLDTPLARIPGYFPLDGTDDDSEDARQLRLWTSEAAPWSPSPATELATH